MLEFLGFLAGSFALGCGVVGLVQGRVIDGGRGNDRMIERDESPANFWFTCLFYIGFGGFILWNVLGG